MKNISLIQNGGSKMGSFGLGSKTSWDFEFCEVKPLNNAAR